MVIIQDKKLEKEVFEDFLSELVVVLKEEATKKTEEYRKLQGKALEEKVCILLSEIVIGSTFEGKIKLISGQSFPDIVAMGYYGVEVKTTKSNQWKSIGSSVAEGTRVDGVERIYMLFGKMSNPIDFMCRPYEECLASVVVTHSPRYTIDMELKSGETFFDKIGMSYDELRLKDNPISIIIEHYRSKLKEGETTWWLGDGESKSTSMVIRVWSALSKEEKHTLIIKGFCFFPEILGKSKNKFAKMALWLATTEGVVCSSLRDEYTAGGRSKFKYGDDIYDLPKVIRHLLDYYQEIIQTLNLLDESVLIEAWGNPLMEHRQEQWIDLISNCAKEITTFPLKEYLLKMRGDNLNHK